MTDNAEQQPPEDASSLPQPDVPDPLPPTWQQALPWVPQSDSWDDAAAQIAASRRNQRAAVLATSGATGPPFPSPEAANAGDGAVQETTVRSPPTPIGPLQGKKGRDGRVIFLDEAVEDMAKQQRSSAPFGLQPANSGHTPPAPDAFPYVAIGSALRATLGPTILGQPGPGSGDGFHASAFDSSPNPATPVAPLEGQVHISTRARVSVEANVKTAKARPRARTKVGRAVLNNATEIELIGLSFIALIDNRLESLQQERPNSEEAKTDRDCAIADCEDLKHKVQAFLGTASDFSTKIAKEKSVVSATTSLAEGIGIWWSKNHVQICDQTFPVALFAIGVSICKLAGADGVLSTVIPGAMAGGKSVADVIKAYLKHNRG